ncbi:nitroreductase family protein [Eubacteriales bacterium KG127]
MEFQEVLKMRQSIRYFKDQDVKDEDIKEMIFAASIAPSGKNTQNWHFVVIKDRDIMEKIASAVEEKNGSIVNEMKKIDEGKAIRFEKFCRNFTLFFLKAPVLIVALAKEYIPSGYMEYKMINDQEDAGINVEKFGNIEVISNRLKYEKNPGMQSFGAAIENFTLKAVDLGYGSCWLTSANYAADEIEEIIKASGRIDRGIFGEQGYFMGAMLALGVPEEGKNKSPKKMSIDEISTFI